MLFGLYGLCSFLVTLNHFIERALQQASPSGRPWQEEEAPGVPPEGGPGGYVARSFTGLEKVTNVMYTTAICNEIALTAAYCECLVCPYCEWEVI